MKITLVPFSPVLPAVVFLRYKSDTSADTFSWCSDLACMICCFTDTVDGLFVVSKSALLTSRKSVFIINSVPTPSVEIASIVPSISSTKPLNDRKAKSGSLDTAERRILLPFKRIKHFFHKRRTHSASDRYSSVRNSSQNYSIHDSESVLSWCISSICSDVFIQ